ncbi:Uncharacterised protein [uncultured archaeon]|nr:Uncharacterised protein [uncultured archaeon]
MDKRVEYACRAFLLVLLPFLLGAFALPHVHYMQGTALQAPGQAGNGVQTYAFVHSSEDSIIQQKISSLFPLAGYLDFPPFVYHSNASVCFEDTGSYLVFPDKSTSIPSYDWTILLNGGTVLPLEPYSVACAPIALGQTNSYKWGLNLKSVEATNQSNAAFVPQTSAYTRLTMDYGILQGVVMIPVAFLLVWYPAAGIIRKIKEGLLAQ